MMPLAVSNQPEIDSGEIDAEKLSTANSSSCLHHFLEQQAERRPHATAVSHEGRILTYAQLNERASQVAYYLAAQGARPESRIGICIERSPELIVAVFGILKAGGAYVPLDPAYPNERLTYIGHDSRLQLILSKEQWFQRLSGMSGKVLDVTKTDNDRPYATRFRSAANPANLAYVIYTSGSTGRPKGVMVEHRSVVNLLERMIERFGLTSSDRVLQFASISWDTSVEEIFPCLASGATLVLRTTGMAESAEGFIEGCRQAGITVVDLPTAFWHLLMARNAAAVTDCIASLRLVIIGGERAEKGALRAWGQGRRAQARLFNSYGTTEAAAISTIEELDVSGDTQPGLPGVPIGSAIDNVCVRVLDEQLSEVPAGSPGELYIGGAGLARGYCNRPALTAVSFIPDPYGDGRGSRLYRTGDVVQRRTNGVLDYVGRRDNQVKIRGYRIELGEIESALRECDGIEECVVAVRLNLAGDNVIVGYLMGRNGVRVEAGKFRKYVDSKLPEYMVPGVFVWLDSIPKSPNGKVDRAALPTPAWRQRCHGIDYAKPQTAIEKAVAEKWSSVFGIDDVGLEDNFFVLGGHSLSATHMISWVRDEFGLELPLRSIFDHPTVRELGALIAEGRSSIPASAAVIAPVSRHGMLPLVPAEEMMLEMCHRAELGVALNLCNAFRLKGNLNEEALKRAIQEIVRRHESLRTTFTIREGQLCRLISQDVPLAADTEDVEGYGAGQNREAEAERLASLEARRPFNFEQGPLFRYKLQRFDRYDYLLTVTMHHVISDAWSLAIFAQELRILYEAFCQGLPSPLRALPIQYADYAVWRNNSLQGEPLMRLASYWRRQLEGVLTQVAIPPDKAGTSSESVQTGRITFKFSPELTDCLKSAALERGATLFMVLIGAFATLIGRLSDTTDVAIRVPVSLRNTAQCEAPIGLFLDMAVMRLDLSGAPAFEELLKRVQIATRDLLAHQELPFKMLLQAMAGASGGRGKGTPFPVTFNFVNTPDDTITLSGLTSEPVNTQDRPASRSKLHLHMFERAGKLEGIIVFQAELYSERRMLEFVEQFRSILTQILSDPHSSIATLSLATNA